MTPKEIALQIIRGNGAWQNERLVLAEAYIRLLEESEKMQVVVG